MLALVNSLAAAGFAQNDVAKMLSELRKFGANGHLYIPGVGTINGITAGNYLDSAGTTSASVDGLVGLVLDGAGSVGPELVTNGNFSNGLTGWTVDNADATHVVTAGAGQCRYVSDTTSPQVILRQTYSIAAEKTYLLMLDVSVYVSGQIRVEIGGSISTIPAGAGKKQVVVRAGSAYNQLIITRATANVDLSITNISVKEVTGIHASQATTGNKPKLRRGIVNLLTQSEFQAGLTDAPTRGGLVSLSSIDGKNAIAFGYDSSTPSYVYKAYAAFTAGAAYTFACVVKMDDGLAPAFGSSTILSPLNDFAAKAASSEINTATYTVASLENGAYIVAASASATGSQVGIVKYAGQSSRTFKVTSYGLFQGTITAEQILAAGGIPLTTTAPASSSAGAYNWEFDGVDDYLTTGVLVTGDCTLVTCGRQRSASGESFKAAIGAKSAGGDRLYLGAQSGFHSAYLGSGKLIASSTPDTTQAVSTIKVSGAVATLYVNGVQAGQSSSFGTAAPSYGLAIGAINNAGTPANWADRGNNGTVAIIGTALSDATRLIFERGLNALSQYAAGRF